MFEFCVEKEPLMQVSMRLVFGVGVVTDGDAMVALVGRECRSVFGGRFAGLVFSGFLLRFFVDELTVCKGCVSEVEERGCVCWSVVGAEGGDSSVG